VIETPRFVGIASTVDPSRRQESRIRIEDVGRRAANIPCRDHTRCRRGRLPTQEWSHPSRAECHRPFLSSVTCLGCDGTRSANSVSDSKHVTSVTASRGRTRRDSLPHLAQRRERAEFRQMSAPSHFLTEG
jgi:hypothetical protein